MAYYTWRSGPFGFKRFGTYTDLLFDKWADPKDKIRIMLESIDDEKLFRTGGLLLKFEEMRCGLCGVLLSEAEREFNSGLHPVLRRCFRCKFGGKSEEK